MRRDSLRWRKGLGLRTPKAVATPSRDGPLRRAKGPEENLGLGNVVRDLEGYRPEGIEGASESRRVQKPFGALRESL